MSESVGPVVLDGTRLAAERLPRLLARAKAFERDVGRAPCLAIIAFEAEPGFAPHVARKRRAAAAAGIETSVLALPRDATAAELHSAIRRSGGDETVDAVFVQFPLPPEIDEAAAFARIPAAKDVDVLSSDSFDAFLAKANAEPPVTVSAALLLLDRYAVRVEGRICVVAGEPSPLVQAFEVSLARRGARVRERIDADAADLAGRLEGTELVAVVAGKPGIVPAAVLPVGAVVIDVGYFNPGGRGDVDTGTGAGHLGAFAPVPGGIGPMTVSALLERTIALAEHRFRGTSDTPPDPPSLPQ